ncbi:MAG: glycosyltransferase family 1 protein [Chloroflexi bacterium]|nr:MAG: glycosyltransferase family 1 protein [Chloroflexota bacterium]
MRVGIDFTPAVQQQAGIGRYTRELVRALAQLDARNQYVLFQASRGACVDVGRWPANFRVRSVPVTDRWLAIVWQRLGLPIPVELFTGAVDVFHSPDFVLPPVRRARTVLTVHDLSFLTRPETSDPGLRAYLTRAVPRAVAQADHILADSRSTKEDLVTCLGASPEQITVVYPGVDPRFRPLEDETVIADVCTRYELRRPFILAVGTLQPRKNYPALIEAVVRLGEGCAEVFDALSMSQAGSRPASPSLVIAGSRGWLDQEIFETVERLGAGDRVRFLGFVRDEDLPALYNAAAILAMPSLYEGFGLPVLEAMACGTPVVTSNVSSLPEVAGDAALLVSPRDVAGLSDALCRLLTDWDLQARLRQRGLAQAQKFTWQKAAEAVLGVYERLAAGS